MFSIQSCLIRWETGEQVLPKRVAAEHLAGAEPRKWQEKGELGSLNVEQLFLPLSAS